ncbi:MAG TPA: phosphoribosyltransferase [Methylomusa anaerophila]|uniref:Cysteine protease StiP n=1 Tax=Methylomusa anaerophila TaxID=1930071 RepID=A0A348AK67_9FIRM|nr:phosphoribosyltransferase [Methylomusa anaerophila]BBB91465.1 cysteine protease StiP precursor [Methylomusa anaerophila]HML89945.1 phosphoribosyltransferase [Methylomusa anaerophila]
MNSTTSQAYSRLNRHYEILDDLKVEVSITSNPYQIPVDALFGMAARQNAKRGFLFVSKVLGKHIPVHPFIPFAGGAALARRYAEIILGDYHAAGQDDLANIFTKPELCQSQWESIADNYIHLADPTLFIGFAETATALGHAMFSCFQGEARYIHTTRENIPDIGNFFDFTEDHSHAPEHRCYAADPDLFAGQRTIVLVDDEITTGNSALNLIRAIHHRYSHLSFVVASLLDWRSPENHRRFADVERELGINIQTVSLLTGRIKVNGSPVIKQTVHRRRDSFRAAEQKVDRIVLQSSLALKKGSSVNSLNRANFTPYLAATGRFGLSAEENRINNFELQRIGRQLRKLRQGARTLCLGTGEFMHVPFAVARYMGNGVFMQSTTRSPIHAADNPGYAVRQALTFANHEDPAINNFIYNIPAGYYDEVFVFLEREASYGQLVPMFDALKRTGIPRVCCVAFVPQEFPIAPPAPMGSYNTADVVFLLKDIGSMLPETETEEREEAIQGGRHYSEMLPKEYRPTEEYIKLYHDTLTATARKVALAAGIVAELIVKLRGANIVLASLARAGTPIGILIKRYLQYKYKFDLPHYSISIIRGKGIDENAILYIRKQHPEADIQFVDGWTGKGAITKQLIAACKLFAIKYGVTLNPDLAVLADPGHCVPLYGTREDFLVPSACLNATVSGLVSRTVHRDDLIGQYDFHGAKYYREWAGQDLSRPFVDTIAGYLVAVAPAAEAQAEIMLKEITEPTWDGLKNIQAIQNSFGIQDINLIKPGVGETTRVLLRRVPWRILVDSVKNPNLKHILMLAGERSVPVEEWPGLPYSCCGLIKPVGGDN